MNDFRPGDLAIFFISFHFCRTALTTSKVYSSLRFELYFLSNSVAVAKRTSQSNRGCGIGDSCLPEALPPSSATFL